AYRRGCFMPEEGNGKKRVDGLSIIQTVFAIITPIVLAVGGWYVNDNLVKLRQPLERVEKMIPLLDRMADENSAKAKMAAHALYLITKDDPELLVRMLTTSGRKELVQVLQELVDAGDRRIIVLMKDITARQQTGPTKAVGGKERT